MIVGAAHEDDFPLKIKLKGMFIYVLEFILTRDLDEMQYISIIMSKSSILVCRAF